MCGRVFTTLSNAQLARIARANQIRRNGGLRGGNKNSNNNRDSRDDDTDDNSGLGGFNMGPGSSIAVARCSTNTTSKEQENEEQIEKCKDSDREIDFLRFGYQAPFAFIINARCEDINGRSLWNKYINTNRCVVIISGFYE